MADPRPATTDAKDFDAVRAHEARNTGEGGGGREETPRNEDDAVQGQFHDPEQDRVATQTPG